MMQINTSLTKTTTRQVKKRSLWADAWMRLRKNTTAVIGMVMLAIIVVTCLSAPLFFDYEEDVISVNIGERSKFPTEGTLLGTDELGRDMFARIIWGGKDLAVCRDYFGFFRKRHWHDSWSLSRLLRR